MSILDNLLNENSLNDELNPFYETLVRHLLYRSGYEIGSEKSDFEYIKKAIIVLKENPDYTKKTIKHLMKYSFAQEIGPSYTYKKEKNNKYEFLFPRMTILNNELYMYNTYLPKDNQKLIKISKINGYDVKEIFQTLRKDGYIPVEIIKLIRNKEVLSLYGFGEEKYIVTLNDGDKSYEFNMEESNPSIDFNIFYKDHKVSNILNKKDFDLDNEDYSNKQVPYSYDSNLRLLKLLYGLSKNNNDRMQLKEIYENNASLFGKGSNNDKNVDWMYITSFFLFNREEEKNIAEYQYYELDKALKVNDIQYTDKIYASRMVDEDEYVSILGKDSTEILKKEVNKMFNIKYQLILLDENNNPVYIDFKSPTENYGCNDEVMKDGFVNTESVFHSVRKAFAHSSYEIIDENYVRVYSTNENTYNYNFLINIDIIKKFINKLAENYTLGDNFPMFISDLTNKHNKSITTREKLANTLKDATIFDIRKTRYYTIQELIEQNKYISPEFANLKKRAELDYYDMAYCLSIELSKTLKKINDKLKFQFMYDTNTLDKMVAAELSKFMNYELIIRRLRKKEIDKILKEVDKINDKFYEHSMDNQNIVLTEIVRNVISPNRNITSIITDLCKNKNKAEGSIIDELNNKTSDYINYSKVLKGTIIAYLNNILLYNFNNKVDVSGLDFSSIRIEHNLKELISNKEMRLDQVKRENSNILKEKELLKKTIDKLNKSIEANKAPQHIIEKNIIDRDNKLNELNNYNMLDYSLKEEEIEKLEEEINNLKKGVMPNDVIYEHLRNSLAHGNIIFLDNVNYEDIGNMYIRFLDRDPETKSITFMGMVNFSDLINLLNDPKLLNSIFLESFVEEKEDNKELI